MKQQKKELRKYISVLKTQHQSTAIQQSVDILTVLEAHPAFKTAQTILLYHSLKDEVDTHAFIQKWYTEKQLLLPVVTGDHLLLRRYTGPQDMTIGAYGIEEPNGPNFTDYPHIDLVVVPGVAFDLEGHRLGRGKGYYDRLLPQLPQAHKIGICFPYQIVDHVPAEPFDICMDEILTLSKTEG